MPRGRRPNITPSISFHIRLSQAAWAKMTLHLYSSVEQRVPLGAYSKYVASLIEADLIPKEISSGSES